MELDYTRRRVGSHRAARVPPQRVGSPSPIRVAPADPGQRPKRRKPTEPRPPFRWSLLLIPAGVLGVIALVFGIVYLIPGSIDSAKAGDCASYDRSNAQDPYATVRCGSSAAAFTVLKVIDGEGNCRGVAGATRSTISTDSNVRREVCLGPKGVDPAAAVNIAQPGDCLTGNSGHQARVPCSDPTATAKIIERFNDMSSTQVRTACDEVPGAVSVYSWTWDTDDGTGPTQASYQTDAVFCLGPVR